MVNEYLIPYNAEKITLSNASAIYHKFHLKLANIAPDTYLLSAAKRVEMFCVGYRKEAILSNTD
jgi:hypothetical protein